MGKAGPLEISLDYAGVAWIAACTGFALFNGGSGFAFALVGGAAAGVLVHRLLRQMRGNRRPLPGFDLVPVEPVETFLAEEALAELLLTPDMAVLKTELLLTRSQMPNPPASRDGAELVLDDVLAELRPDSRVVQLFDPARMPTAGELKSRIDRHLRQGRGAAPQEPQPDASQALYDALADLRRSLG